MATHPPFRRRLLVEGRKDLRVIPYLMEAAGIEWPKDKHHAPVKITAEGGSKLLTFLESPEFQFEVSEPSLFALGVILDADREAGRVWQRGRHRCLDLITDLPDEIPTGGLISTTKSGKRFGVWIMPDNRSPGMMESFLKYLVPAASVQTWAFAQQCAADAKGHGADYIDAHKDKAEIHTWLAWRHEPGRQLHEAIEHQILDPAGPLAQPFVNWFRGLFQL